jgi:uncharacterized membrane protein
MAGVAVRRRRYERKSPDLEFNRVANLSDGVYAIAMTLLVVTIGVPAASDAHIGEELERLLPQFGAFFLSFAVIAFYWRAHHQFLSLLTAVDGPLLTWNLVYLAMIAFLPFLTDVLGEHGGVGLVVAAYALNVAAISAMESVMLAVAHVDGLLERPLPADVYRYALFSSTAPVVVFVISAGVALLSVTAAYACWASLLVIQPLMGRRRPADADAYLP